MSLSPDIEAEPALLTHCKTVYDAMRAEGRPTNDNEYLYYEGFVTHLFRALELSTPYYTAVMRALKAMDCVRQARRGGGSSPSQWVLLREPTLELYEAAGATEPITNSKARNNHFEQRQNDLNKRVGDLEEKIDLILNHLMEDD